jgi:hypothetical protein
LSSQCYLRTSVRILSPTRLSKKSEAAKNSRSEPATDLRKAGGAGSRDFACGLPCPGETPVFAHGVVARQARRRRHLLGRSVCLDSRKDLKSGLGHKLRRRGCLGIT